MLNFDYANILYISCDYGLDKDEVIRKYPDKFALYKQISKQYGQEKANMIARSEALKGKYILYTEFPISGQKKRWNTIRIAFKNKDAMVRRFKEIGEGDLLNDTETLLAKSKESDERAFEKNTAVFYVDDDASLLEFLENTVLKEIR